MSLIQPFVAVIGESLGKVIDKLNFNKNKIHPRQLVFLIFTGMFIGLFLLILVTKEPFPILSPLLIGVVLLMIFISFSQNIFDFTGLSYKNLSAREPIKDFEAILASFIAFLLFPSEREIKYLIGIILGTFILYWGNANSRFRIKFDKGFTYLLLGMMSAAILANIYKFALDFIPPSYLFIFRVSGILLLLPLFGAIGFKSMKPAHISFGLASGFIYFIGFIFKLFSIQNLGLNITIMILLLGPVLRYFLSASILKERIKIKQIISSILLITIIVLTLYL